MKTMLKLMAGCVICVAQADIGLNGNVAGGGVLFGADGLVEERSAAVGELVPWHSPDAALALVDEKVEHLGVARMLSRAR